MFCVTDCRAILRMGQYASPLPEAHDVSMHGEVLSRQDRVVLCSPGDKERIWAEGFGFPPMRMVNGRFPLPQNLAWDSSLLGPL